jgi:hypothetical protein
VCQSCDGCGYVHICRNFSLPPPPPPCGPSSAQGHILYMTAAKMPICTAALGHFLRPRVHIDGTLYTSLHISICLSACYLTYAIAPCMSTYFCYYTDKKENKIVRIKKEIQNGAVANSYMTNGLLIYGEIFVRFLVY